MRIRPPALGDLVVPDDLHLNVTTGTGPPLWPTVGVKVVLLANLLAIIHRPVMPTVNLYLKSMRYVSESHLRLRITTAALKASLLILWVKLGKILDWANFIFIPSTSARI